MTWIEAAASLQLLAEERYGAPRKAALRAAVAEEDRAAAKQREALGQ